MRYDKITTKMMFAIRGDAEAGVPTRSELVARAWGASAKFSHIQDHLNLTKCSTLALREEPTSGTTGRNSAWLRFTFAKGVPRGDEPWSESRIVTGELGTPGDARDRRAFLQIVHLLASFMRGRVWDPENDAWLTSEEFEQAFLRNEPRRPTRTPPDRPPDEGR